MGTELAKRAVLVFAARLRHDYLCTWAGALIYMHTERGRPFVRLCSDQTLEMVAELRADLALLRPQWGCVSFDPCYSIGVGGPGLEYDLEAAVAVILWRLGPHAPSEEELEQLDEDPERSTQRTTSAFNDLDNSAESCYGANDR